LVQIGIAEKVFSVMGSKVKVRQWRAWKYCELDSWWTVQAICTETYILHLKDELITF